LLGFAEIAIKRSEYVKEVEIFLDEGCWSVIILPDDSAENCWHSVLLQTLAKEALRDAVAMFKSIDVVGSQAFNVRAQGFEATCAVMQSAASACDGDACGKQHPAYRVPIHVRVEGVQLPCTHLAGAFVEQVADLALTVTTALGVHPHIGLVEASKDNQGWTIEMTAKEDMISDMDYLLTVAKNALSAATGNSEHLYIIGCAAKPFVRKTRGFVTILGDMQDASSACWDLYSKGTCSRNCECQWLHPECLMPINVTVKEMSK